MAASAPLPSVKGFDPELVRNQYPAPIARTFEGKLQQSQTPLHRLLGLTDVFEVALKYCAIIAIQEYLRLGVRSREVDRRNRIALSHSFAGLLERLPARNSAHLPRTAGPAARPRAGESLFRPARSSSAAWRTRNLRLTQTRYAPCSLAAGVRHTDQTFLQYSWIERSEENLPIRAAFKIAILDHCS